MREDSFGPKTGPITDRMQIRDELLKSIIEVYTIEGDASRLLSSVTPDVLKFPGEVRIGSDVRTGEPIFNLHGEGGAAFMQLLEDVSETPLAPGRDNEFAARVAEDTNEANLITPTPAFAFADLEDPSAGKWSSISLDNLDFRFAVSPPPCTFYLI